MSISQHCMEIDLSLLQTLNNQAVTYAADLWALGCVMYQMLVGKPPFKAGTEYLTFQLISAGQVDMPPSVPSHAQDLLRRLLLPDASKRLGQTQSRVSLPCIYLLALSWASCIAHDCLNRAFVVISGAENLQDVMKHPFFESELDFLKICLEFLLSLWHTVLGTA